MILHVKWKQDGDNWLLVDSTGQVTIGTVVPIDANTWQAQVLGQVPSYVLSPAIAKQRVEESLRIEPDLFEEGR